MLTAKNAREGAMFFLAGSIMAAVVLIMIRLFGAEIPAGNRDAIMFGMGIIFGCFKDVYGWFFGSSKGSADKTEAMAAKPPVDSQPGA